MPGRGDNNKNGSAGRGSSNQSNQGFIADDENQKKSNHSKASTGNQPSEKQKKTQDQDADRNQSHKSEKK